MMTMKTCSNKSCKQINPQPLANFYNETAAKDGKSRWCKECHRAYRKSEVGKEVQKRWRQSEGCKSSQEKYNKSKKGRKTRNAWRRKYRKTKVGEIKHRAENKRYRERHPNRNNARKAIWQKVSSGNLPRAAELICAECGRQADEYHHESYKKEDWFDVIPLCMGCHIKKHS